ncbi:MAG: hypothetical protein GTO14_24700 [Anaerolineales bacterium]|nr:hypothetical protein [Anaerolineales bacterium]
MLSFEDIVDGIRMTGVGNGDTIMVHSSYKSLGGVEGGAETVIDALVEAVAPDGTVLFPTFNFESWTETHYFDIRETFSRMGVLTELARWRDDAIRTPHPIYSFAALGKGKDEFGACDDVEAFGDNSVFARFHELNGMILSIGVEHRNSFTFNIFAIHKAGGHWRRIKEFSGIYVGFDGVPQIKTYSMFVRATLRVQTQITPGIQHLIEKKLIKDVSIGEATVYYVRARPFFDAWTELVNTQPEKLHFVKPIQS